MSFELHPEALAELTRATLYYATAASKNIALAFLAEFERVAELVDANQQLGTKSKGGLRVHPLRRFPYVIVYRELASGPFIYAVAHQKQAPGYWVCRI